MMRRNVVERHRLYRCEILKARTSPLYHDSRTANDKAGDIGMISGFSVSNYFIVLEVGLKKLDNVNCLADMQVVFRTAVRGKCTLSCRKFRVAVRYAVICVLHLSYLVISDDLTS
jgi:hypothetical protein